MVRFSRLLFAAALVAALARPAGAQMSLPASVRPADSQAVPRVGAEFPQCFLPDTTGRQVSLSSFRGKAVILSFWSCYSDTCFTSVRVFDDLLKEYAARGLVAPTVCSEVPPALATDGYAGLLKRCSLGQVVLIDKDQDLTKRLGITEFPTTFLIDRDQVVWRIIPGIRPLLAEDFRDLVRSLVGP